ncbi:reverse transcriptase domain-containing protein [Tanacetum coccineum]|uniref:Reverse transcriptase domain-containing protein n=1 Tax=Tanacetum coccineum TaxID=301880 RepID=A0ABQ5CGP5_9ASTR
MITVLMNSPIKQRLSKPKKSRRVAKWAIELGEHDIVFQERGDKTPKDFLFEVPLEDNKKKAEEKADTKSTKTELSYKWKFFTNRAASSDGSGAGLMLTNPEGKEYTYSLCFGFEITNNEVEYEALLAGLRISQEMEIISLAIFVNSQLLVNQIKASPQADEIIKEVHEGSYGFNVEPRSMVVRITKQGYYWPSMHRDATNVLQDCEKCNQKEIPFSLTYGFEAIIPIPEHDVAKDDSGRIKEVDKRIGNKEIASIEEAYYRIIHEAHRYGYMKSHMKTVKNGQTRTQERKSEQKPEKVKSTVNSSQSWSTEVNKTQNVSK